MSIYAFAISIFFISWAMIFGMCIDYRSAEGIGIRIVLYLKRTFNEEFAEWVNLWSIRGICIFNTLMTFTIICDIILLRAITSTLLINSKWSPLAALHLRQ